MRTIDLALVNHDSGLLPTELRQFSYALEEQLREDVAPIWGRCANPWVAGGVENLPPKVWQLHFWGTPRDAHVSGALGYHQTQGNQHVPVGHVFVKTIRTHGEEWSVIASHEAIEMLGNEWINLEVSRTRANGAKELWPRELCDACQGLSYQRKGVALSDFVYPEWFIEGSDGPFDHLRQLKEPFQIHESGYAAIRKIVGGSITERNVYGAAYPRWRKKSRPGSRKVRRT